MLDFNSGTNAEFTKADTVIFRTDLYNMTTGERKHSFKRTLKYDSKWLDSKLMLVYSSFTCYYFAKAMAELCYLKL